MTRKIKMLLMIIMLGKTKLRPLKMKARNLLLLRKEKRSRLSLSLT